MKLRGQGKDVAHDLRMGLERAIEQPDQRRQGENGEKYHKDGGEDFPGDHVAIDELPFDRAAGFVVATVQGGTAAVERDFALLGEYKHAELCAPQVIARVNPPGTELTLRCTDAPAFWTTVEFGDSAAQPRDNGLLLLPGEERTIPVTNGHSGLTVTAVRTIRDTYA